MGKKHINYPTEEKENSFFEEVAIESNMSDLQPVKDVYFAILRVIMNRLKKHEYIYLPKWGEFLLRTKKGGKITHKDTGQEIIYRDARYIAFKPFYRLKYFFREK